jgi:hypothetical protein
MWCKNCRQDVPAIASEQGGAVRCARCRSLTGPGPEAAALAGFSSVSKLADHGLELDRPPGHRVESPQVEPVSASVSIVPPRLGESFDDLESWTLAAELQRIRRRYDSPSSEAAGLPVPQPHLDHFSLRDKGRYPNAGRPTPLWPKSAAAATESSSTARRKQRRSSPLVWATLSLGLMAFVCGAVLLGWSLAVGRSDLWNLGLPIALVGQFGLLLGLVWQLDGLWAGNRHAADKLDDVDDRLDELKQTAALVSSAHSSPAQAFYVHMAGGASPHLLLADLKGQLDLLAVQMSAQRH